MIAGFVVGLLAGSGILVAVAALRPPAAVASQRYRPRITLPAYSPDPTRLVVAVGAALLVFVWLAWFVVAVAIGAAIYGLPMVITNRSGVRTYASKTEAIASWVESLRDTMAASRGLEGAIVATAATAPVELRGDLSELLFEIEHGVALRDALVHLAERLEHPTADMVIATLVMAIDGEATAIGDVLDELATASREIAAALVEVHSSRQESRTNIRMVIVITSVFLLAMMLIARDFLEPYTTVDGQLVLAVLFAGIGGCFVWIAWLSRYNPPARLLRPGAHQ